MNIVQIPSRIFFLVCALFAIGLLLLGKVHPLSSNILALEVVAVVIGLFIFGSTRYRIDKNAMTYGMALVILATFIPLWWPHSSLRESYDAEGISSLYRFIKRHVLTLQGLDALIHIDTLLFILGLTFFVAVIVQTRLLETASFVILNRYRGKILPTIALITGLVSIASGILDGVSMIGIMIRVLVMLLFMAKSEESKIVYIVMVSTIVTTVCGMWLAYGEPPNLIMKSNLHPLLDDAFFLRYCLPVAIGSYLIVYFNLRKFFKEEKVQIQSLDILDKYTADVKFFQTLKHGEALIPTECVNYYAERLGDAYPKVEKLLHGGSPLGEALWMAEVPETLRHEILGHYLSADLSSALDQHYSQASQSASHGAFREDSEKRIHQALENVRKDRVRAQKLGAYAFLPFVAGLALHAANHEVPLFISSFVGFLASLPAIFRHEKIRRLAFKEAIHEYREYLFLVPLFLSITLLQKSGFFSGLSGLLRDGLESLGSAHLAYVQFSGAAFLSAILDNNVVADFAGRALQGLNEEIVHLFAMSQIAGYAVGGCWTHIGSAQSVVAYAFITREIDPHFTPFQWIRRITPLVIEIFLMMTLIVYGEAFLMSYFR